MTNARQTVLASATLLAGAAASTFACVDPLSLGQYVTDASVAPDAVIGPTPACEEGYAHPNACCDLTLGSIDCVGDPASPFTACPDGSATYADPSSCCLLPTSDGGGTSGCSLQPQPPTLPLVKTPKTCTYPCTSGLIYVPSRNSCCPIKGELDAGACEPPIAYSCPDESPDAQSNCVNEFCGTCPTGWSAMMSAPEICCRTQGVATWCFSRAVGPGTSTAHLP